MPYFLSGRQSKQVLEGSALLCARGVGLSMLRNVAIVFGQEKEPRSNRACNLVFVT